MGDSSINAWKSRERSITENLKRWDSSTVTFSKVPERLRRGKEDDYEPRIISFGPYHHGKPRLQAMEKYKWSFLEVILSFRPEIPCKRYIEAIKEEEAKIRTCYIDYHSDIDSEEFVEMMLIDGCFIVGYLLRFSYCGLDDLESMGGMHDLIQYDILLLENQLPFFILIKIFKLLEFSRPSSFMDLAINYLNWVARDQKVNFPPPESVLHLLHLYHSHCLYTPPQAGEGSLVSTHGEEPVPEHQSPSATVLHEVDSLYVRIYGEESDPIHQPPQRKHPPQPPSATVLYEAGVKFKKKVVKGSSILDVCFKNGKMMIPPLVIDSFTKSTLRNLVAFEQLYPSFSREFDKSFTAYVVFMDFIVNTPADVALLHKKGIIRHFLGSDKKAANFLNSLIQGVSVQSNHYLANLNRKVHYYQQKKLPKWRAVLMHNYCNSPWAVLGIMAGGILLAFTLVQTILSGYSAF